MERTLASFINRCFRRQVHLGYITSSILVPIRVPQGHNCLFKSRASVSTYTHLEQVDEDLREAAFHGNMSYAHAI
jgi:hypothetical protein